MTAKKIAKLTAIGFVFSAKEFRGGAGRRDRRPHGFQSSSDEEADEDDDVPDRYHRPQTAAAAANSVTQIAHNPWNRYSL
jgi:hypothetical protein